ncbi:hypothetical protein [Entomomonas asaccharolytica]|uniref:Uncharacterized protein n=1 Tax=Entomomonas asaccharolytica TaxID=2785331 RepID=A0A974RW31_9GAMM|nr:hypothetical protein [Entomomonas asaccharolytica]QQP84770.1 hypothetical protein JHT90_10175 [Entomomonas asaccharolytica]
MMRVIILIFLFLTQFVLADTQEANILISANTIKEQNPEITMLDGEVQVNVNDNNLADVIKYSYSNIMPAVACDFGDKECEKSNIENGNQPILTFSIVLDNSDEEIHVSYMCTSIGIMNIISQGMRDIFCGSSYVLRWNGHNYVLKE